MRTSVCFIGNRADSDSQWELGALQRATGWGIYTTEHWITCTDHFNKLAFDIASNGSPCSLTDSRSRLLHSVSPMGRFLPLTTTSSLLGFLTTLCGGRMIPRTMDPLLIGQPWRQC